MLAPAEIPRRTVWEPRDRLCTCAEEEEVDARNVTSLERESELTGDLWDANVCVILLCPCPERYSRVYTWFDAANTKA